MPLGTLFVHCIPFLPPGGSPVSDDVADPAPRRVHELRRQRVQLPGLVQPRKRLHGHTGQGTHQHQIMANQL